jgi:hypothetical protein
MAMLLQVENMLRPKLGGLHMRLGFWTALALVFATPAVADVEVRFEESAPKDRFTITNTGNCALPLTSLIIDLTGSQAGLIFDVTGSGAGVSVFQRFELVSGAEYVAAVPRVKDGDQILSLQLKGLKSGQRVAFTIDVDDTAGASETRVSGSEIQGATVRVGRASGTFGKDNVARVKLPACTS